MMINFYIGCSRTGFKYQKTGDLITYIYRVNLFATKTENLNPFFIFDWIGI